MSSVASFQILRPWTPLDLSDFLDFSMFLECGFSGKWEALGLLGKHSIGNTCLARKKQAENRQGWLEFEGVMVRSQAGGNESEAALAIWPWVNTHGIPCWGRCTTHFSLFLWEWDVYWGLSLRDPQNGFGFPLGFDGRTTGHQWASPLKNDTRKYHPWTFRDWQKVGGLRISQRNVTFCKGSTNH